MSFNLRTAEGYINIGGGGSGGGGGEGSFEYTSKRLSGIKINNDMTSPDYHTIENSGVLSVIQSPSTKNPDGTDVYEDGTILVQTGIESEDNPPVPVKVKGINTAAFMPIEKEITEDSDDDVIPTSKAVADFVLDNTDSNTWIGTKEDYENEKDDIETGTKVFITDDEGESVALIHSNITGRDAADSHPMSAITGLSDALDGKVPTTRTVNSKNLSEDVTLSGADVAVTGYEKAETASAIAETDTVNAAIGKLEKKVDDKVQKTKITSANETTSTIAITDNSQMAMVTNIKGKTVKNLFNGYTNMSIYTVASEKYNGHECITATAAWGGAYDANLTLSTGKTYFISAMVKLSAAGKLQLYHNEALIKEFDISVANQWVNVSVIYTPIANFKQIRFESPVSRTTTISEFMVVESDIPVNYIEPASLASVPVESLVSVGKNIADGYPKSPISYISSTYYYNVTPNTKYTISYVKSRVPGVTITNNVAWACHTITFYDNDVALSSLTAGQISGNGAPNFPSGSIDNIKISITTPSGCNKIGINFGNNNSDTNSNTMVSNVQIERGEVKTAYEPYNKITALVPQDIRNLPDYGLGIVQSDGSILANEVDFENGVYYHRISSMKLKGRTYVKPTGSDYVETSITGYKRSSNDTVAVNFINGKYTTSSAQAIWGKEQNKIIAISNQYNVLMIYDTAYTTPDAFAASLTDDDMVVYELATPEVKPLTDYIRPLPIENGGTLTLVNPHNLDVNSVIKYKKEV